MRTRTVLAILLVLGAVVAGITASVGTARPKDRKPPVTAFPPSVTRFDLSGYKIETSYSLGRNTGSTFDQTYTDTMVQGVPVAGPYVGYTFPPAHYVALPIAPHTLYIAWLDDSNAIIDAFVMNFTAHTVFDYAPGSSSPESAGRVWILQKGANRIP
jgi:hypothetical protein